MGSCEDRWKILRENTVRFLVNAPADLWSKRPATQLYIDERKKKKKKTSTWGKKRKENSRIICYVRVTWAPFKSGELLSSVKLDCLNIRFSVARSAHNKFYRGRSAQFLTWWFRHHGETSGGDAGWCVITATTSGVGHVWACSIFGEEPVLTHCWHRHRLLPQKLVLLLYMDFFFFISSP